MLVLIKSKSYLIALVYPDILKRPRPYFLIKDSSADLKQLANHSCM